MASANVSELPDNPLARYISFLCDTPFGLSHWSFFRRSCSKQRMGSHPSVSNERERVEIDRLWWIYHLTIFSVVSASLTLPQGPVGPEKVKQSLCWNAAWRDFLPASGLGHQFTKVDEVQYCSSRQSGLALCFLIAPVTLLLPICQFVSFCPKLCRM